MFLSANRSEPVAWNGLEIRDYTAALDLSSSVAWIDVPQGTRHPRARSDRSDKYYVVVAGTVRFTTEGRTYTLGEGDVFVVPRGVSFEYENPASEKARLVLVHTPMFDAAAEVLE